MPEKEIHKKSSFNIVKRMNIIINVEYALQYVDHTFDSLLNSVTSFTKRKLPK